MPGILQSPEAAVAVLEREPYWAAELKWQFADGRVFVRSCSQWRDVVDAFDQWPRCLGVIELEAAPAALFNWLAETRRRPFQPPVLVVARADHADLEWILREAGVASVQSEPVSSAYFAAHCRRLLERSAHQRPQSLEQT